MLNMKSTFQVLSVNDVRLKKDIDNLLKHLTREAIEVWVRKALSIIPIWSTASHYTLQTLASAANISIQASPVDTAPDRSELGKKSGFGGLFNDGETWYFEYSTTLDYLISNENSSNPIGVLWALKKPTPYDFQLEANFSAQDFVERELNIRFPEVLTRNIVTNVFQR